MTDPQQQPEQPEIDPRFPSGDWTGFWIQQGFRGQMRLRLSFSGGEIKGVGEDCVGRFVLYGSYELPAGKVTALWKKYVGKHAVLYEGWGELGVGIWGVWQILRLGLRGGFHIRPIDQSF